MGAFIAAAVAGAKDHDLTDYLPRWWHTEPEAQSDDQMLAALKRLAQKG